MPGGMPPVSGVEQRLQDMERRFRDQEESKKTLEGHVHDLEQRLKEEHEKLVLQSLKAKEEESLSMKVEQQLREMQDKLRREKYEQELHDSRGKAENQLKELERRILEERETWMAALKNQMKERETVEQEVEESLTRRLHDVELRFQKEKNEWALALRQKDDDFNQTRRQLQMEIEKLRDLLGEKDDQAVEAKEALTQERRSLEQQFQAEQRAVQTQLESQIRETSNWKAQLALLQSQLHQVETQYQQERTHWQGQTERLEHDQAETRKRLELQTANREEELKREFSRRDQERAQYWEGVVGQIRTEKESLRGQLMHREEELARAQMNLSELKREMEVDRTNWQTEAEKIRRAAKEEGLREMPEAFRIQQETLRQQLESERKQAEQQHHAATQQLRTQLNQAQESLRVLNTKLGIERQHADQKESEHQSEVKELAAANQVLEEARVTLSAQIQGLQESFEQEKARWAEETAAERAQSEKQTKEFMRHIAEAQLSERALREEMDVKMKEWDARQAEWSAKAKEADDLKLALQGQEADLENARNMIREFHALQMEWKKETQQMEVTQDNLREAFNAAKTELVQVQNDRSKREDEWKAREADWTSQTTEINRLKTEMENQKTQWDSQKAEWETKRAELEKAAKSAPAAAAAPASVAVTPEATKALTAIRQQMQEMQTLLTWLKPTQKPFSKAA